MLQVRSTNRAGVWGDQELSFGIRVLPAWWQQWGFRALALMAAAGMVWALVAWRTRQLRLQSQRLELNVQERSRRNCAA